MKHIYRTLILLLLTCALVQCKKDKNPLQDEDTGVKPVPESNQTLTSGVIDLPSVADKTKLSVVTIAGAFPVKQSGAYDALANGFGKQAILVEDEQGNILLSAMPMLGDEVPNAKSTAKSIFALMPWTAYNGTDETKAVITEISRMPAFEILVSSVRTAVESGRSPLEDEDVLASTQAVLNGLRQQKTNSTAIASLVPMPEIDRTVMPTTFYEGGTLRIENDQTTTAAWGVELKDGSGTSLTGHLILPGNRMQFPSLSSIWAATSGNMQEAVFQRAEPLTIPLAQNGKYKLVFQSPNSKEVTSALTWEAIYYNLATAYESILKALGLENLQLNYSTFFNEGCVNQINDAMTQAVVDAMRQDQLTSAYYISQAATLIEAGASSMVECAELFNGFPGSSKSATERYLKRFSKFLNFYSKLESSFILGRLLGDMIMLKDIQLCRQVVDGKLVPCFTLKKPDGPNEIAAEANKEIELSVYLGADHPEGVPESSFNGVRVQWSVTKGDGTLASPESFADERGFAKIRFVPDESKQQEVKAFLAGPVGNDLQAINYFIKVEDIMAKLRLAVVGKTLLCYSNNDGQAGDLIAELVFKNDMTFDILHVGEGRTEGEYTYRLTPVNWPEEPSIIGTLDMTYRHPYFFNYWLVHSAYIYEDLTVSGSNGLRILRSN